MIEGPGQRSTATLKPTPTASAARAPIDITIQNVLFFVSERALVCIFSLIQVSGQAPKTFHHTRSLRRRTFVTTRRSLSDPRPRRIHRPVRPQASDQKHILCQCLIDGLSEKIDPSPRRLTCGKSALEPCRTVKQLSTLFTHRSARGFRGKRFKPRMRVETGDVSLKMRRREPN